MSVTKAVEQGLRSCQEDRHYVHEFPNGDVFMAVMEGHAVASQVLAPYWLEGVGLSPDHHSYLA